MFIAPGVILWNFGFAGDLWLVMECNEVLRLYFPGRATPAPPNVARPSAPPPPPHSRIWDREVVGVEAPPKASAVSPPTPVVAVEGGFWTEHLGYNVAVEDQ